jgi:hypothetical protein
VASAKVDGMKRAVEAVAAEVYDEVHAKARAAMGKLTVDARYKWPTNRRPNRPARPHSRDLFRIDDQSNGSTVVKFVLQNDARDSSGTPYAFFIKTNQHGIGGKSPWVALVRRPLTKAIKILARDIVALPVGE